MRGPGVARGSDFGWALAGAASTAVGGFAFVWLTARLLGLSSTGFVLAYASWFTLIFTVGRLGFDTALVWMIPRALSGAVPVDARTILKWAIRATAPAAVGLAAVLIVFADSLGSRMFGQSYLPEYAWLIRLGALLLPGAVLSILLLAALRGMGRVRELVLVDQIVRPVGRVVLAGAAVALVGASAQAFVVSWLAVIPIGLLLAGWFTARDRHLRSSRTSAPSGESEFGYHRRALRNYAMPRIGAQLADAANLAVGTAALAALSTADQVAMFGTALRLVVSLALPLWAFRFVIAPLFAFHLSKGHTEVAQRIYGSASQLILLLVWPAGLAILAVPEPILRLFGADFVAAAPALQVMVVGVLVMASLGNMQAIVLMTGGSGKALMATAAGLVVNTAVTVGCAASWGAVGAACGWTGAVLIEAAVLSRSVRGLGLVPLPGRVRESAFRTVAVLGPGYALAHLLWPTSPVGASVLVAVSAALLVWSSWSPARSAWRQVRQAPAEGGQGT